MNNVSIQNVIYKNLEIGLTEKIKNFTSRLLSSVNFERNYNDYKKDDFILQLFRFGLTNNDFYEKRLFELLVLELLSNGFINELCTNLESTNIGPEAKGIIFEKFVIDSLNKSNDVKILSTQYKKTDAIIEYKNEKYILEIKLNYIDTVDQVNKYKLDTNIDKSVSVNGTELNNVTFSDVFITSKLMEYSKMFVKSIAINNKSKKYEDIIINLIMKTI